MTRKSLPNILLFGAGGQVGHELARSLAPLGRVISFDRAALDLSDAESIRAAVRSQNADIIVNAAAYTQVDLAESEPELASCINARVPEVLSAESAKAGALLVHFSTDYVFDGIGTRPYAEDNTPAPNTVYGSTKLAGDQAVLDGDAMAYVFRVGWVYGNRGKNFLRTIQRLARERDELRVVADQRGSPTWSRMISEATTAVLGQWLAARRSDSEGPPRGLFHMAGPDHTTWHEFASEIVAAMPVDPNRPRPTIVPIQTEEYPTRASRPAWSVLDSSRLARTFALTLPPWREQLVLCLDD